MEGRFILVNPRDHRECAVPEEGSSQGLSVLILYAGHEGSQGGRIDLAGHVHSMGENFAIVWEGQKR